MREVHAWLCVIVISGSQGISVHSSNYMGVGVDFHTAQLVARL